MMVMLGCMDELKSTECEGGMNDYFYFNSMQPGVAWMRDHRVSHGSQWRT